MQPDGLDPLSRVPPVSPFERVQPARRNEPRRGRPQEAPGEESDTPQGDGGETEERKKPPPEDGTLDFWI